MKSLKKWFTPLYNFIQAYQFLALLALSIFLSCFLLGFRIFYLRRLDYLFLVWNLFLAAVPLFISAILLYKHKYFSIYTKFLLGVTWLLFFPNAPYLISDFIHLHWHDLHGHAPFWYDVIMLMFFTWNGLLMGLWSLSLIQDVLSEYTKPLIVQLSITIFIFLGSYGVYIGRYLRWNSWNIATHPLSLFRDIVAHWLHPEEHLAAWGMTFCFSLFVMMMYLFFRIMKKQGQAYTD